MTEPLKAWLESSSLDTAKETFDRLRKIQAPSPDELAETHNLAAELAHGEDGDALYWLGEATLFGKYGLERNVAAGLAFLSRGAAAGNDASIATLASALSETSERIPADQVTLDPARAVELYKQVPENSPWYPSSLGQLARAYHDGNGVSRNDAVATDYFRRSAELGQAVPALRYATRLEQGVGTAVDKPLAHAWFETALKRAEKVFGDKSSTTRVARSRLGRSWLRGYGGQVNAALGLELLRLAAREGDKEAMEELEQYRDVTPEPDLAPASASNQKMTAAVEWTGPREAYDRIVRIAEQHMRFSQSGIEASLAPHFILRGGEDAGCTRFTRLLVDKLMELGYLQNGAITIVDMLALKSGDEARQQLEPGRGGLVLIKDTRPAAAEAEDSEQAVLQVIVSMLEASEPRTLFALHADDHNHGIDRLLRLNDHFARFFKEVIDFADGSPQRETGDAMSGGTDARITSPPEAKVKPASSIDTLFHPLRGLVGLDAMKKQMEGLVSMLAVQGKRQAFGLPVMPLVLHMVFQGSPGTGKTTVVRMYGAMLHSLGHLAKGHVVETDGNGFIAESETKTRELLDCAEGGILFINEAHALGKAGGDNEAIALLMKLMEERRDRLVVIVAGPAVEMGAFLDSNRSLRAHFGHVLEFPNYTVDEMLRIMTAMAQESGYSPSPAALEALKQKLERLDKQHQEAFANGWGLKAVLERSALAQARRLATIDDAEIDRTTLMTMLPEDMTMPDGTVERGQVGI